MSLSSEKIQKKIERITKQMKESGDSLKIWESQLEEIKKSSLRELQVSKYEQIILCKFCSKCAGKKYPDIFNCNYVLERTLCDKHQKYYEKIKRMIKNDENEFCPSCKKLGAYNKSGYLICVSDDCRVSRFYLN